MSNHCVITKKAENGYHGDRFGTRILHVCTVYRCTATGTAFVRDGAPQFCTVYRCTATGTVFVRDSAPQFCTGIVNTQYDNGTVVHELTCTAGWYKYSN